MPRKFYGLPPSWNPGYVIPDYVMAEPPARGTMTTQWLPRGTISDVVPDYGLGPGKKLLGRTDAGLGSLSGNTLAGSCFSGGNTLSGSTLSGNSLGATRFQLEELGADALATIPAPAAPSSGPGAKTIVLTIAAAAGLFWFFSKRKSKKAWGGG